MLLSVENLSVSYGNIKALHGISFAVNDGDFVGLPAIQAVTGEIPLQVNCRKRQFLAGLDQGRLPRNVMYWIDSGVESVEEANAIMERVRQY